MLQYGSDLSGHVRFVRKKWCCFYILLKGIVNHLYVSFHFGVNIRIPWTGWLLISPHFLWSEDLYITLESINLLSDENPWIVSICSPPCHPRLTQSSIHSSILHITFPVIILLTHLFVSTFHSLFPFAFLFVPSC